MFMSRSALHSSHFKNQPELSCMSLYLHPHSLSAGLFLQLGAIATLVHKSSLAIMLPRYTSSLHTFQTTSTNHAHSHMHQIREDSARDTSADHAVPSVVTSDHGPCNSSPSLLNQATTYLIIRPYKAIAFLYVYVVLFSFHWAYLGNLEDIHHMRAQCRTCSCSRDQHLTCSASEWTSLLGEVTKRCYLTFTFAFSFLW
ncbi:hypothetical protein BC835DRAFT_673653 [Cytidiella melzeri]|nr:hypothetical protein BC835DRAFT_673653 [Cytidiella melzeri]